MAPAGSGQALAPVPNLEGLCPPPFDVKTYQNIRSSPSYGRAPWPVSTRSRPPALIPLPTPHSRRSNHSRSTARSSRIHASPSMRPPAPPARPSSSLIDLASVNHWPISTCPRRFRPIFPHRPRSDDARRRAQRASCPSSSSLDAPPAACAFCARAAPRPVRTRRPLRLSPTQNLVTPRPVNSMPCPCRSSHSPEQSHP